MREQNLIAFIVNKNVLTLIAILTRLICSTTTAVSGLCFCYDCGNDCSYRDGLSAEGERRLQRDHESAEELGDALWKQEHGRQGHRDLRVDQKVRQRQAGRRHEGEAWSRGQSWDRILLCVKSCDKLAADMRVRHEAGDNPETVFYRVLRAVIADCRYKDEEWGRGQSWDRILLCVMNKNYFTAHK